MSFHYYTPLCILYTYVLLVGSAHHKEEPEHGRSGKKQDKEPNASESAAVASTSAANSAVAEDAGVKPKRYSDRRKEDRMKRGEKEAG